jgi:hypothetical protein
VVGARPPRRVAALLPLSLHLRPLRSDVRPLGRLSGVLIMTLATLHPGDVFRLADGTRACFILKAHRDGNDIRRPYVDAIELDAWGQQRRWRCFAPDRTVRVVRRAA